MNDCCVLGHAPYADGRVLHETDNFFVCAGLGAMGVEGYLMVVSKDHYVGSGELPSGMHQEMDELIVETKTRVLETYGTKSIAFEHGPRVGMCGWGGCIDHLHVQIFPRVDITRKFAVDLIDNLDVKDKFYRVDRVEGFRRTAEIFKGGNTSYVMLETPEGKRLVSEVSFQGPSQWLRRLVAEEIGTPHWNWRMREDRETAARTVERMHGKF